MTWTFISWQQATIWVLTATLALVFYVWKVRPWLAHRVEFHQWYSLADSFYGRVWAWLKVRWDLTTGAAIMALPAIWNGILDGVIWASINLADFIPAIAGLDLSGFVLPKWLEFSIRVAGAVVPIIRAKLEGKGSDE